jgi:hypothetical protein
LSLLKNLKDLALKFSPSVYKYTGQLKKIERYLTKLRNLIKIQINLYHVTILPNCTFEIVDSTEGSKYHVFKISAYKEIRSLRVIKSYIDFEKPVWDQIWNKLLQVRQLWMHFGIVEESSFFRKSRFKFWEYERNAQIRFQIKPDNNFEDLLHNLWVYLDSEIWIPLFDTSSLEKLQVSFQSSLTDFEIGELVLETLEHLEMPTCGISKLQSCDSRRFPSFYWNFLFASWNFGHLIWLL